MRVQGLPDLQKRHTHTYVRVSLRLVSCPGGVWAGDYLLAEPQLAERGRLGLSRHLQLWWKALLPSSQTKLLQARLLGKERVWLARLIR